MDVMTKENTVTGLVELNLGDYFTIFFRRRKSIVALAMVVGIMATAVSLVLPKTYTATAVVIPLTPGSGSLAGVSMGSPISDISSLFGGAADETNRFLAILKSRTMAASVIHQFNLMERYKKSYLEDAIHTQRGDCCGFLIKAAGITIWAPGDSELLEEHLTVTGVDVLLLPIAPHVFGTEGAIRLANSTRARHIIPCHYGTYDSDLYWCTGDPQAVRKNAENADRHFHQLAVGEKLVIPAG